MPSCRKFSVPHRWSAARGQNPRLRERSEAIDLNGPDRLIFELNQIVGSKKSCSAKKVTDFFRVAVERPQERSASIFLGVGAQATM